MNKTAAAPQTLTEAVVYFADPDRALAFVAQLRWPNGAVCAHCGEGAPMFLATRRIWKCRVCRKQFSVKLGTIFEDSPLGLDKWLPALWMLANCKNGISSYELHRALGVTQKTAWFMLHRIRLAMQTESFEKLGGEGGEVEADETFIGGKRGNMHKSKKERVSPKGGAGHMEAVAGLLERKASNKHTTVRLSHVANTRKDALDQHIRAHVQVGTSLFTDMHPSYKRLAETRWGTDYKHQSVDHALKYVDGRIHTNGMENFWSLLKRSIRGTYVSVDPFHLFRYLDEQSHRFNNRYATDGERFIDVARNIVGRRITYEELISADMKPSQT
jgi:transposase-like protein